MKQLTFRRGPNAGLAGIFQLLLQAVDPLFILSNLWATNSSFIWAHGNFYFSMNTVVRSLIRFPPWATRYLLKMSSWLPIWYQIDGLMQKRHNSSAFGLYCTNPSKCILYWSICNYININIPSLWRVDSVLENAWGYRSFEFLNMCVISNFLSPLQ